MGSVLVPHSQEEGLPAVSPSLLRGPSPALTLPFGPCFGDISPHHLSLKNSPQPPREMVRAQDSRLVGFLGIGNLGLMASHMVWGGPGCSPHRPPEVTWGSSLCLHLCLTHHHPLCNPDPVATNPDLSDGLSASVKATLPSRPLSPPPLAGTCCMGGAGPGETCI